jgi:hypothetical protein
VNPRSHDPIVDGARVVSNSLLVAPARSSAVSSMLSPPATMEPITVSALVPLFAPWRRTVNRRSTSPASPTRCASTAAGNSPADGTRFGSSNLTDTRVRS